MAERVLVGTGVGTGVGIAPVYRLLERGSRELSTSIGSRHSIGCIRDAIHRVADELEAQSGRQEVDEIMGALSMMLRDASLLEQVKARLADGVSADRAIRGAFAQFARSLQSLGGYFAERSDDLTALAEKVIDSIAGVDEVEKPDYEHVLVVESLSPMDASKLDAKLVKGVVTRTGTATSHTGIVLRGAGIPAVLGVSATGSLEGGVQVLVDATSGQVYVAPSDEELSHYARVVEAADAAVAAAVNAKLPVTVLANLGSSAEAEAANAAGAEGVGLFRTELLFLGRTEPPTLQEQVLEYTRLLSSFSGKRVVVRVLDTDTDKPLPFLFPAGSGKYANRGFQVLLANRSILETQLEALASASLAVPEAQLWVMAPMVLNATEAQAFAQLAKAAGLRTVGVMVEVPEIVAEIETVAGLVDFLSIGTNDLAQYTLDRNRHASGAAISDARDPQVMDLITKTVSAAKTAGIAVGVCGEAAADPVIAAELVALGVDSLSASPALIPALRAELAKR